MHHQPTPLPILQVSTDSIEIETKDNYTGNFSLKNIGGGILSGQIFSRTAGLVFDPIAWEGNSTITYTFNSQDAGLSPGQEITGHAFISYNGGEVKLPVTAKLTKMSISTVEGYTIANLHDFFNYAKLHPDQARRIFVDSEFYMLLLALEYEFVEVYESLHKDSNRERALDNFFILSGLKAKTAITVPEKKLDFIYKPYEKDHIHGHIVVEKSEPGYVEAAVTSSAPWINCFASRVISSDFKDGEKATIHFSIDPAQIDSAYAREQVTIGDNTVEITCRRLAPITFVLNRTNFRYEDEGIIRVLNNTGRDIRVEVFCPESYVRFSARSYLIGAIGEIPFNIKLSAFLSAQLFFRKLPYMKTAIEIKATSPGKVFAKNLPIIAGEW